MPTIEIEIDFIRETDGSYLVTNGDRQVFYQSHTPHYLKTGRPSNFRNGSPPLKASFNRTPGAPL